MIKGPTKFLLSPQNIFMLTVRLLIIGAAIVPLVPPVSIAAEQKEQSFISFPFLTGIRVYQKFVSTSREGLSCPMYPSCSGYACQAIEKYGLLRGAVMSADRLHRCNHDMKDYQLSITLTGPRYLDLPQQLLKEPPSDSGISPFNPTVSQDSLLKFADDLMAEDNYEQAVLEYKRILAYYPQTKDKADTLFKIYECYMLDKKYSTALDWIRYVQGVTGLSPTDAAWAEIYLGYTYYILENYPKAIASFRQSQHPENKDLKDSAKYYEGLCYLKQAKYGEAKSLFASISAESPLHNQSLKAIEVLSEAENLPYKKPVIAGLLSAVLPGAGYLYTKKPQSALAAFVTNGLFIWGVYSAFEADEPGVGAVLSLFELGWYSGAIYGGVVSAHKYNFRVKKGFEDQFELKLERSQTHGR